MAFIEAGPRVAETSATTGTGALTLAGALTGYQRFSAVCATSDTLPYFIVDASGDWEMGIGTYSSTNTLTRTTVIASTNANAAISCTATKTVFLGFIGMARLIQNAATKTTPASNDKFGLMDSADSNTLKGLTYANLLAAILPSQSTWTPVLTCATPGDLAITYSAQSGTQIVIGNLVVATFNITTSAFTWSTASGAVTITGLSNASAATYIHIGECFWRGITKTNYTHVQLAVNNSSSVINLNASGSGQLGTTVNIADMPSTGTVILRGTICYFK